MAPKHELKAIVAGFPRPSQAQREALVQALADILVFDYEQNQAVREPSGKTSGVLNRSNGREKTEQEAG